jgi:ubiquitin
MSFQTFVKTLTGNTITLELDYGDTILKMKEKIQDKEGIAVHQQRLIIGNRQLEDERRVEEYGIANDKHSGIWLVLNLSRKEP